MEGHQATWDLVDPLEVVPQDHLEVVCMDLQVSHSLNSEIF